MLRRVSKSQQSWWNRCNVWVFNPTTKACWLKFEKYQRDETGEFRTAFHGSPEVYKLDAAETAAASAGDRKKYEDIPRCLHGVMTSSGNAYMNWQSRIMYQTWQNHASQPGSIMKAFTRVLHKGRDDELMFEIPTMRFEPIQTHCDSWCDYPVADRSDAFARWSQTADSETCSHIIMLETDHVIVKSPPSPSYSHLVKHTVSSSITSTLTTRPCVNIFPKSMAINPKVTSLGLEIHLP